MRIIIMFILVLLLIPIAIAKQTVTHDSVTIESVDTFYCSPIYSDDGCLVKATIGIYNDKNDN